MPAIEPDRGLWAVIPAGGAGTRLWPLSRSSSPKFLHDLTGTGRTLLQATVDRLAPLVDDRVLVVTGRGAPRRGARAARRARRGAVLAEPSPRDSMAAIGLAAAVLERRDPAAVMGSFAADHVDRRPGAFAEAVAARRRGGPRRLAGDGRASSRPIPPRRSATSGSASRWPGTPGAHAVAEFVEKPAADVADGTSRPGGYRWNAGMFVVRPGSCWTCSRSGTRGSRPRCAQIAADPALLEELWPTLPRIAVDHAVAEPAAAAGRVAVVPAGVRLGRHRRLRLAAPRCSGRTAGA